MTRLELARAAAQLRDQGLTQREIGDRLRISRTYVSSLLTDPTGDKDRERKRRLHGTCKGCGGPTYNGGARQRPEWCAACWETVRPKAQHGTHSMYKAGCTCDPCVAANRAASAALRHTSPPNHGLSGYMNYYCRCPICKQAASNYRWLNANKYQRAYDQRTRHPCADCGKLVSRIATRCRSCATRNRYLAAQPPTMTPCSTPTKSPPR